MNTLRYDPQTRFVRPSPSLYARQKAADYLRRTTSLDLSRVNRNVRKPARPLWKRFLLGFIGL